jgi:hypothetical protein
MTTNKKTKKVKIPEPFWNELVSLYFSFCSHHFQDIPSFDGSQPRDLKNIVVAMRKRATHAKMEWTELLARRMLNVFLKFAYQDKWLRENFIPFNLNRQKDKIFFQIKQQQLKNQIS